MSGIIELPTNEAAYLPSRWRDATDPQTILSSLTLAQADIVIQRDSQAGTSSTSAQTSASSPAAVNNGNSVFAIPLTATDLNFTGFATIIVAPASALEQRFRVNVVSVLSTAQLAKLGTPAGASISADIAAHKAVSDAVKAKTDNLPGSPAAVGSNMNLADGAITATKIAGNAIGATAIAANAITSGKIEDGAITSAKFGAGAFAVITDLLTKFVRLLARKDEAVATDHAAELAIINANTGTGAGSYNNTGQAQEALATSLTAANDVLSNLTTTTVTVISHQQPGGGITLVKGDTYKSSNNRPLQWVNPAGNGWPTDLSTASVKFTAIHVDYVGTAIGDIPSTHKIQADGSVVQATAPDQEIIVELESSVTGVDVGLYEYDVEVTIGTDVTTLVTTALPEQKPPSFALPDVSTFKLEVLPQFTPAP